MAKWWVFKCKLCGKKFKEKFSPADEKKVDLNHIGSKTHIVSTHQCKDGAFGCGELVGAKLHSRKRVTADDR